MAVRRVAGGLRTDIERVSGVLPILTNRTAGLSRAAVPIGTIGHSPVVDKLVAPGRLDVSEVAGRWEASGDSGRRRADRRGDRAGHRRHPAGELSPRLQSRPGRCTLPRQYRAVVAGGSRDRDPAESYVEGHPW